MLLEIYEINTGIYKEGDIKCFTITNNKIGNLLFHPNEYNWLWKQDETLEICIPKKHHKKVSTQFRNKIAEVVYYSKGMLLNYFKMEIDTMPIDMKRFRGFIFSKFRFLMNKERTYEERCDRIREFLKEEV